MRWTLLLNLPITELLKKIRGKLLNSKLPLVTKSRGNIPAHTELAEKQMRYVNNAADLDVELKKVDESFRISDDAGRKALSEFRYVVNKKDLPSDPHSQEYYAAQMKIYCDISGRNAYDVSSERSEFDLETIKHKPFPYYTKSPQTVGDQLMGIGYLIKTMNLHPDAHIIEFGPGWGNTTLHLAQMGYRITAVEIEKNFCELIKYRTRHFTDSVNVVNQDMLEFATTAGTKYDIALFYESFHHCRDHLKMIKELSRLADKICFAAEPIVPEPCEDFPYPWGVRIDGMSAWSIRKFGWMELGFELTYFLRTMNTLGWDCERHSSDLGCLSNIIIAKRR